MSKPECPFCGADPFHYVDIGVGAEAVAVVCCDLGDLYFRGAREPITGDVVIDADAFREIGNRLSASQHALSAERARVIEECANLCERYRHDSQTLGAVPTDPMLAISVSAHEIAQAIRSLAVKEGEAQWQDISTAPKDRTRFLAWGPLWRCPFPAQFPDPVTTMVWIDTCEVEAKGRREYATHWMPLPAPPAVKEGEG